MNKKEIVSAISKKTNFTRENTETALNAFIEVMQEAMTAQEDKIVIKGLGTFKRTIRAARMCNNPQKKGEMISVPERVKYTFKISPNLAEDVNK